MVEKKDGSQRRVYSLPTELVDRIVEFQIEKGYPSEVEAVRKLLDDALKSRDDYSTIINRFIARLKELRMPSEVAKDVLVGHPLVSKLTFNPSSITFELKDGYTVSIDDDSSVQVWDEYNNSIPWPPKPASQSGFSRDLDDEIPF